MLLFKAYARRVIICSGTLIRFPATVIRMKYHEYAMLAIFCDHWLQMSDHSSRCAID
jgi:hypothetical protein